MSWKSNLAGLRQLRLVALQDRAKHAQERRAAVGVAPLGGPRFDRLDGQAGTLEVLQESGHQSRERRHLSLLVEHREYRLPGNRTQRHVVGAQLVGKTLRQLAGRLFVAERLDEGRAVLRVGFELPFPVHGVLGAVDERRRVPVLGKREVLDVDSRVEQIEVGLVLAFPSRSR